MPRQDTPHAQWPSFLGNFGLRHFGWNVVLEHKSGGHGKVLAAGHSFLEELSTDGANGDQRITIVLGSPFHPFHEHVVSNPRRLRAGAGNQVSLEIDTAEPARSPLIAARSPQKAKGRGARLGH